MSRGLACAVTDAEHMEPYIKAKSPLRGDRKPAISHGRDQPKIEQRQREEVAATRRALKKAARREGKQQIQEEA